MLTTARQLLFALATLVAFLLIGRWLSGAIGWAVPGSVVGMLLAVFSFLVIGRLPKGLALIADKALPHLALLFIPPVLTITQVSGLSLFAWMLITLWLIISWVISFLLVVKLLNREPG
jgi:holin-like protein